MNSTTAENVKPQESWKFPKDFWLANAMELCERAAYYGFYILLTVYLTDIVDFTDMWGNTIAGLFAGFLYFLPPFSGAIADRIGFKKGLILAFGMLSVAYFFLGIVTDSKVAVIFFLVVLMIGSSFIKPLITGTVAKTSNEANRARAFSLFYWIVNIGAFGGKTVVPWIRKGVGLEYINFFSAGMSLIALIVAVVVFKEIDEKKEKKDIKEIFNSLIKILSHPRLMALTLITSGFWLIQSQLYATMPKFILRMVGQDANPSWLANVNPFVVVLFVVFITQWMKKYNAVTSIFLGMLLMPFSAFAMSLGPWLEGMYGLEIGIVGDVVLHPFTVMMIVGISIQALAECFISPRFLEYFSFQAPKGEEGTYLGFSHLHSFISYIAGGVISGALLSKYCPDPKTLPEGITEAQRAAYYADAHTIWWYFAAIGVLSALSLLIFIFVTKRNDKKAAAAN